MIQVNGRWFTDDVGRVLMLRGVNVSGNCKLPATPNLPSHNTDANIFFQHRFVSFVGRPFPLDEADSHFERFHVWGFNFLRFCITWEAIEHSGPGIYDREYIDYVVQILRVARKHGFKVFIDPHQDCWSRFSGGSGAPGWTLEIAGFDIKNLVATEATIVQNLYAEPEKFPKMIWSTNYYKLAAATMFTLFFGGSTFAPLALVEGVNMQEYLQSHFINAMLEMIKAIVAADLHDSVVLGYDTLNEPHQGYLGHGNLQELSEEQRFCLGPTPTPFESMMLGNGYTLDIRSYGFTWFGPYKNGKIRGNPKGRSAWKNGKCLWAMHGIWNPESMTLLLPEYFATHPVTGQAVDFLDDFWKPFVNRFGSAIRKIHPEAILFLEPSVNSAPPVWQSTDIQNRLVYAPHWYDGVTLMNKKFSFWNVDVVGIHRGLYDSYLSSLALGYKNIVKCFVDQLGVVKNDGIDRIGEFPCIIGEIGIPMDLDNKKSYKSGNYKSHIKAMNANMSAIEQNLLNVTLWNYCPVNNHEWGDQWNGEDLSLVTWGDLTLEQISRISSSGSGSKEFMGGDIKPELQSRVVTAFVRPYPMKTSGIPISCTFDLDSKYFKYHFHNDRYVPLDGNETIIFVPEIHYGTDPEQLRIVISDGTYRYLPEKQMLLYKHSDLQLKEHFVWIRYKDRSKSCCNCNIS